MQRDRIIKISHSVIFTLLLVGSIIALGVSGALVGYYNNHGYPSTAYRDRIRILLVASVWTTFFSILLTVGFQVFGNHIIFGILAHLIPIGIAFILFLIGVSSLTALTDKISCGNTAETFAKCSVVKGLVVISWIDTIFLVAALVFICVLAFKAKAWGRVRESTLVDA